MVKMKECEKSFKKANISSDFSGRRARVDQRAIQENGFFSELDRVQLFSPNIDILGAAATEVRSPPNELEIAIERE